MPEISSFDEYTRPIVAVPGRLGGSATVPELYEAVVEEMRLDDKQLG